jgi:hypothetical protein
MTLQAGERLMSLTEVSKSLGSSSPVERLASIMTNYQRGIPSTPMKAAAVVRAESLSPASFPNQSAASARCWI